MSLAPREKRASRGPHGWTDQNRDKAAAVNRSKVQAHDAQAVPIIRDLRARSQSWRSIAAYLDLCMDPPGRRGAWTLGGWTHKAVQRIAVRHGIQ